MKRQHLGLALLAGCLLQGAALDAQVKHPRDIRYPAVPEFTIPTPQRVVLENGMVVLLLEDHELPLVRATALIRTGARLEPEAQVGLAGLMGDVLRSGGTTQTQGDRLDEVLENKAASIETSINLTSGRASLSCLAADFPAVLKQFAEVLRSPAFDPAKLEVARTAAKAGVARQNDDPGQILFRELGNIVYGKKSPYARQPTYASLGALDRDDLIAWHQEYFQPNRVILGILGDFDSQQVLTQLREVFGDWKATGNAATPDVFTPPRPFAGVYFVEKADITQSNIVIGDLGVVRNHPDFFALEVMNQVFSGGFGARLFTEVRTRQGLAYAVSGSVGSEFDYPGLTSLFTTTKVETTVAAIDALLSEMRRMVTEPPTDEEVAKAKKAILASFIFQFDTPAKVLERQLTFEYFGYPLDWLSKYRARIEAITPAEVRQAAATHLKPERAAILVVGPSAAGLEKYGAVKTVDITIPEPATPRVEVTAAGQQRAAELLALVVRAVGGEAALDGVTTLRQAGKVKQQTPNGPIEMSLTASSAFPDHFRQDISAPFGTVVIAVTPAAAFMASPQGAMPLPPSDAEDMRRDFRRSFVTLLKARKNADFVATAAGTGKVGGTAVEKVQVEIGKDLSVISIDPATGRMLAIEYQGSGPGGAPGEVGQHFSDFRAAGPLNLPFASVSRFNGETVTEFTLDSIEVNPTFDAALFDAPKK